MGNTARYEFGVIYNERDYVGFWRRISIIIIDMLAFGLIAALVITVVAIVCTIASIDYPTYETNVATWVFVLIAAFIYFPVLKLKSKGTIGYRVLKCRLVALDGRQVSLIKSTFRFMFLVLGQFNAVFDLIWLGGDSHKQGLRDKIVGTFVVTTSAEPISRGIIRYPILNVLGMSIVYPEVEDDTA
jgi:uncharacterized RDD family membrane protein YckC